MESTLKDLTTRELFTNLNGAYNNSNPPTTGAMIYYERLQTELKNRGVVDPLRYLVFGGNHTYKGR